MEFKDVKTLTNSEIGLYKKTLENEFDISKVRIEELCKYLEKLDKEFNKADNEIKSRQNLKK